MEKFGWGGIEGGVGLGGGFHSSNSPERTQASEPPSFRAPWIPESWSGVG